MNYTSVDFINDYLSPDRLYTISDTIVESGYDIRYDGFRREVTRKHFKKSIGLDKLKTQNCVIFCKLDYINEIFSITKNSNFNHILITSNSDFCVDKNNYNLKTDNIKLWIGSNVNIIKNDLIQMPLALQRIHGGGISFDISKIFRQLQHKKEIKKLVYLNHKIDNNTNKRKDISDYFSKKTFVTHKQNVSFDEYLNDLYNHFFVFSPEGNGIDCHRIWEALYLGTIPIVQRSILTEYFSNFLPILIMDNFQDITEEYLLNTLVEFNKKEYDYKLITFSYWKNLIEKVKENL
jgi:hypothetical protein